MGLALGAVVLTLFTATWIWFARHRRRQVARLIAERGVELDELVSLARADGFLVVDYYFGGSLGLPRPTTWWCPGSTAETSSALLLRLRDEGRLVVKRGRPLGPAVKWLDAVPHLRVIENREFALELGNPLVRRESTSPYR